MTFEGWQKSQDYRGNAAELWEAATLAARERLLFELRQELLGEVSIAKAALQSARYGVADCAGTTNKPVHSKMDDGYWVPWHVASLLIAAFTRE